MPVTNQLEIDIKAKSDKATTSLDGLISKLNEVNTALNGLNTARINEISNSLKGLKGVHLNVGSFSGGSGSGNNANNQFAKTNSLLNTLTATSNKANSSFLNLNKTVFKMAATWGMFYASAYPFIRVLNAAWQSTQSAMDYVETYNYYSVTMDKIFKQVGEDSAESFQESYINSLNSISEKMTGFTVGLNGELLENYSKNLGADPNALMNYQARIGAVTNAVGLLEKQSVDTQKALSMLSQDLSSLSNTELETVMTNLQSGLIGQSRALYRYGIDITNMNLKQYALANGISKSVSAMTQSEKMQLRLIAILDQSKVAWGDMANTVNSVANQYRIFNQNVSNLSRVLGNLFLPIVAKTLPYINALMISLRQMFSLLGFKLYGDNWLKDTMDGISSGYSGGIADLGDDMDDLADSTDGAANSAKKLKKALMGFDELNIIDPNTSSGSGSESGGAGFDLTDAIEVALGDYESIWNKAFADAENKAVTLANRIMSYIKKGNFYGLGKWISDNLASELDSINWNKIYKGAEKFGTGLAQFLNGLIQPSTFYVVGKTVANSLNTAIYTALAFGKEFDFKNLGVAIGSYWNGIFDNFDFAAFGETVGIWVGGITKTIATAIKTIKWDNLFDGIKEGINGFFKGLGESGVTIGDIAIVIGALTIKKILKLSWGAATLKLISSSLTTGVVKLLGKYFGIAFAKDTTIGVAIANGLSAQLSQIGPMIQNMKAFSVGDAVFGDFSTLNAAMTTTFGSVATSIVGIGSMIGGITLTVHEFFDMWENGWDVLSEILKDAGIALAAFGAVALGLVSGPIGLLIAGVAAVGSTLVILAHDQLPDVGETIKNALTVPGGVSINDLTTQASDNILKIGDAFTELGTKVSENNQLKTSIEDTADSILEIQRSMQLGVTSVDEGVNEISQLFMTLQNNTQSYYNGIANTILGVYGEGGVLEGAFDNYKEVAENTVLLGKQLTDEQQAAYEEYLAMEDKTSEKALELLRKATGTKDDVTKAMDDAKNNINAIIGQIDWDQFFDEDGNLIDEEGFKAELAKVTDAISQSQTDVQTAITDWNTQLYDAMDEAIAAGDTELAESYQALIDSNNAQIEVLNEQLAEMGTGLADTIQEDLLGKMKDAISQADSDEAAKQIADTMSASISTISDDIETAFSDIGVEGAGWAADATDTIMSSIFDEERVSGYSGLFKTTLTDNWKSAFDTVVRDVKPKAEESGKFIVEGASNGVEGAQKDFEDTMTALGESGTTSFDVVMDINSPSKVMYDKGKYIVEGLNNGISETSASTTEETMQAWGELITTSFDDLFTNSFDGVTEVWSGLATYFEDTVFADLNSAIDDEFVTLSDTTTTNFDTFIESTTLFTDTIGQTFLTTTANIQTMFDTMWKAIKTGGVVGANSLSVVFESILNNVADSVNGFLSQTEAALSKAAALAGMGSITFGRVGNIRIPRLNINAYRTGGFPEDGLFYANHTELVGQFSNGRTAVANNEQIVEGIRSGVASAVREELGYYLRDIADNTSATANNTEDIKNKPSQSFSDRDVARANVRGSRSMGLTLRTT